MIRYGELVVPGLAVLISGLYWWQVRGQDWVVVLVPHTLAALTVATACVLAWQEAVARQGAAGGAGAGRTPSVSLGESLALWVRGHWKELALIGLAVAYYLLLRRVGFHLDNLLFVLVSMLLLGVPGRKAAGYALAVTVVVYGLTYLLQVNVPGFPWQR